jgi:hypothetical protein
MSGDPEWAAGKPGPFWRPTFGVRPQRLHSDYEGTRCHVSLTKIANDTSIALHCGNSIMGISRTDRLTDIIDQRGVRFR